MYKLLHDQSGDIEITGTYAECLARFLRLCAFSYERHHLWCYDTYTIHPLN